MSINRKRGFATLSPEQRRAVSRKGGQAKVPKGFAKLSPEEQKINARKAALAMHAARRKKKEENNDV
jgi:hypothetical protein